MHIEEWIFMIEWIMFVEDCMYLWGMKIMSQIESINFKLKPGIEMASWLLPEPSWDYQIFPDPSRSIQILLNPSRWTYVNKDSNLDILYCFQFFWWQQKKYIWFWQMIQQRSFLNQYINKVNETKQNLIDERFHVCCQLIGQLFATPNPFFFSSLFFQIKNYHHYWN